MDSETTVCPVCTLYLRPGMTLKSHLTSHPKQKVIEALVRLSTEPEKQIITPPSAPQPAWPAPPPPGMQQPPGNHSFIYQQFMSSTTPQSNVLNVNPLGQQYVTIPAVFNSQMMCSPYVYQQQQVIMSSGAAPMPPRVLPIEAAIEEVPDEEEIEGIDEIDAQEELPDLVMVESDGTNVNVSVPITEQLQSYERIKKDEMDIGKEEIMQGNSVISQPLSVSLQTEEEQDRELGSPGSNASSDYIRVRRDLNKSCQTQIDQKEYEAGASYVTLTNSNEHVEAEPYSSPPTISIMDMDGMNLMLNSDFMQSQLVSQVDEFDYNNRGDRPGILMNIGEYTQGGDESVSIDSANIRADEHMPPRGDISGQESNASDIAWSRVQYNETSSCISTSYNLLARESWDGSDASDNDVPPLQSRDPQFDNDDMPTVSGYSEPAIQYKCPTCGDNFSCPKERREHQAEKHDISENIVGSKIGKKKVKKLVIKPKKVKEENNFDNVFTNKLKIETESERKTVILETLAKTEEPLISNPVVCTICEGVYTDNAALKQHQLELHNFGSDRYKCAICQETFTCEPKFTEHLLVHPLECRLCGKYFYRRQNLQLHMKRHLGIRPYKCTICIKSFLTKQKLEEHKNVHTGYAPIKCTMCDETFRRHSNLVQHRNRHHFNVKRKIKDYVCQCGEVFHSRKKLAWHKEIHENKPKACTQCSEKFIHMSSLTRHMRRAHDRRFVPQKDRSNENVECPICKGVYLRSSLDMHIRNHSGQRPFTCSICNKDFTTKWNLKLHKWTHASRASKPYKCDLCKGAFIRESDYTSHMNSHKSIRPYTCNYCGAQFIRKYNCQRHVQEHEKKKTYACTVCNKTFHRSYYLNDHMRVHSGVRPFACHICGKTSTTKSNHNKHVRIHHAREPVSTEN